MEFIFKNIDAIVWLLLTAVVAAHFAWRNNFKARRATACSAFRAAILAELGSLYPNISAWPSDIDRFLRSRFTSLQAAVTNFRPFVPWWNRWRFDRAWLRYRCSTGREIDVQVYHHYMGFHTPGKPRIDPQVTFHSNVAHLLSFADEA